MQKTLIISHGDCDGICSAAIALMKYSDADVAFAQPFTIVEDIENALNKFGKPDLMILLDIAYSEKLGMKLVAMKDVEVIYIDHHPSSLEMEELPNVHSLVNTEMSGSQLTAMYFGVLTKLAEIGAIGDKVLMVSKMEPLLNEAELIRKSLGYNVMDDDFRVYLCRGLVKGVMPSKINEVKNRAVMMEHALQEAVETAKENIIFENDMSIVIKYPKDIYGYAGATASKIAIERKKMVFLMFKVSSHTDMWMITARAYRNSDVDLNRIMKKLNGGGHKFAAAGRVPVGKEEVLMNMLEKI
jgi:RecJ-like exonuclease